MTLNILDHSRMIWDILEWEAHVNGPQTRIWSLWLKCRRKQTYRPNYKRTPKKPVKKGVKATYYFGKSKQKFNRRLYEHLYYVTSRKMDEPSAQHFCQAGHSAHDLVALGLEHVRSRDPFILRAREHLLIKKFDSYRNGLNQEPWTWLATLASIFLLVSHSIYVLLDEYDCSIWFIKHACDHGNLNFPKILKLCKVLSWIWWESFVGHFTK